MGDETFNNVEKSKQTCLDKYGVEHYVQTEECQQQICDTNKRNYGVEHVLQVDEFKQKQHDTMIEKYGSVNTVFRHTLDNLFFDSSWELCFYIYNRDKYKNILREPTFFLYYDKTKQLHRYYPDFKVNGKYYEIKGEQFIIRYKNGKVKDLTDHEKYLCMKKHNVKLITGEEIQKYISYVKLNYPKNFIESCKI